MEKPDRKSPDSESGIALVLVLIVLLLTSVLALEIKSSAFLYSKLAKNKRDDYLMEQAMQGQLEILKQVLLYDLKMNQVETLDDVWLDEKYTKYQKGPSEEELQELDEDRQEPVSSEEYQITAKVEDEARKFNLHNLEIEDETERKLWEQIFLRLLVIFREDYPDHALNQSEAEDLLRNLRDWIKRRDDDQGIAKPATAVENQVLVTPDELLMIEGFTREIFFDQKPEREGESVVPGLYRYLTCWSEGRVNLNTADPPMVHALFREQDRNLADRFLEWRDEEAEEQPQSADPEAEPRRNALNAIQDLGQIDGFDTDSVTRNQLQTTAGISGSRFSIHMTGEAENGFRRQYRWVIERHPQGFTTLLTESRNDPDPEAELERQQEKEALE